MAGTRDRARLHSDGGFDGRVLLSEQTKLLLESTPADINFIHFLKLRLSAQQRATAQRNYWQRVQREGTDSMSANMACSQSQGGIRAPAGSISTASVGRRNWRTAGSVEDASVITYDAEPTATTLSALSKADALMWAAPHGSALPWTAHSPTFEDMPAAVSVRRGAPAPEVTELVVVSAADPSEDGENSQRRISCPLPEEDVYAVAPFVTTYNSAAAVAVIDERPAMACGKPQVPVDVDEMKDVPLEPCPHCGRTFALGRLQRHVTTCERHKDAILKVRSDEKSRGVLSVIKKQDRTAGGGGAVASTTKAAGAAPGGPKRRSSEAAPKPEKWRKQSAQLRNAMAGGSVVADDDRVPCPSCGRRFSDDVMERHIPICKSRSSRVA
ncbi:hypothetical protein LPMP_290290 [Leishmania panamensis]|uniref:C2HC/C3H-type domain-containing protein n=1 Tax=Leishmania panamensis TaxID=5679 RepID=A0A088RXH4_LEIPA|nr:hypothetical protein LPMP_290290 [Leishmania panamensis]AIN99979.1 hypothetical protein LPMP_290290 [Leishmania panamensis]